MTHTGSVISGVSVYHVNPYCIHLRELRNPHCLCLCLCAGSRPVAHSTGSLWGRSSSFWRRAGFPTLSRRCERPEAKKKPHSHAVLTPFCRPTTANTWNFVSTKASAAATWARSCAAHSIKPIKTEKGAEKEVLFEERGGHTSDILSLWITELLTKASKIFTVLPFFPV